MSPQDEIEFGYIEAPHKGFPVVLDSPRDGNLKDFPIKQLLVSASQEGLGTHCPGPVFSSAARVSWDNGHWDLWETGPDPMAEAWPLLLPHLQLRAQWVSRRKTQSRDCQNPEGKSVSLLEARLPPALRTYP